MRLEQAATVIGDVGPRFAFHAIFMTKDRLFTPLPRVVRDRDSMTAAAFSHFLAGLVIGVMLGFVLGPLVRYWLVWRVGVEASREDDLSVRVLERFLDESSEADSASKPEDPRSPTALLAGQAMQPSAPWVGENQQAKEPRE